VNKDDPKLRIEEWLEENGRTLTWLGSKLYALEDKRKEKEPRERVRHSNYVKGKRVFDRLSSRDIKDIEEILGQKIIQTGKENVAMGDHNEVTIGKKQADPTIKMILENDSLSADQKESLVMKYLEKGS